HELRPVDEREPLLRLERHGLEAGPHERLAAGQPLACEPRLSLADERQREMRERREVAGGSDRAAARHDGENAALEEREEELDRLDPRAGVALRERVRAQEQGRAHDLVGIRLADAAGVRAKE